ncbi:malonate decarboxylase holo-[acyl-carrier-protein] synthase [Xanthomonas vesicatoria]|uniref:malonate decarboxylase holo-[acyl-carrier-protein] synthase n=1 Tax=Xanthomonas vesicatoria TaxID=56460 RepID=UPI000731EED2|nr:malonate decarboxylase holo-[acyl-carrier-protein] synthase [Xanthomonas vesicatoria]KTF38128.1 phosphoribosyl-dephospho-CoA transferase [Xanthomonas vesicatoria]MCC8556438.1 malonate decarboxylase holo-[acyl-carrier-protein] synthase [Xanthomonas vesicatoria]MCC8600292.1 malonate decarboxylase holo-[acyl-carrier-protein] synthase [Xanthomonas vesicatoria]MCC8608417.1 malonate decarboxylase holo-[acyl-carrier-protein] synthase [Xanthomonas vesicatoria]MCC8673239.1 malonate decarboxylase hol
MAARHALVWLRDEAQWQAHTPGTRPRLQQWFAAGLPAVVARGDGSQAPGSVRLGVPLPPAEGKQRLALQASMVEIVRCSAPLSLEAVIAHAPGARQPALQALHAHARAEALDPRVFGSFAWQALTGLTYVHAQSDLDLLWSIATPEQGQTVVALLQRWEQRHGLRADGELLLAGDIAVNWREYAGNAQQVLVKSGNGCGLLSRAALFQMRSAA